MFIAFEIDWHYLS